MATIYRFIVENKYSGGTGDGRNPSGTSTKKGAGKKGLSATEVFGSSRGGVEHGRRMRAINPLINKATGGYWEKGLRLGRAGIGLSKNVSQYGLKGVFAGPSIAIIIALIIQGIIKIQRKQINEANKQNAQNYKQLENGVSAIHGEYNITRNFWNGAITYNENR